MMRLNVMVSILLLILLLQGCMGPYFRRGPGWQEACTEENQEYCRDNNRRGYHCWE